MFYLPRAQRGFALFVLACLGHSEVARAARAPQDDAGVDVDATSDGADATGKDVRTDAPGIFQPGTQPGELTQPIRASAICADCHGQYADYDADGTWRGTMMANAARDPLFHAALTVARQDEPVSGDLCIRCHAPRAWLFGRSEPALISNLEPADFESVQCDFCHRLNTGPNATPYIGNGQYFVANDFIRRGPIRDAKAPHDFQYSEYHEESRLCGLCHDVSNPLRNGFAIERTYTEWLTSSFATEGKSCQSCHMPSQRGFACGAPDMPERDAHAHEFAGGNYWMPKVIAGENPTLPREPYEKTAKIAEDKLKTAADVTLQIPTRVTAGQKISFQVRVENKTGHKLPTGYPEGRRMWLEVEIADETGKPLFQSGAYDRQTATRRDDPQLRTYEVRMAANGVEGFHFILQDEVLQDNRIPPRGFVARPDTKPVGRDYPVVPAPDAGRQTPMEPVLAHWDDAPYEFVLPRSIGTAVVIRATLWYQTTSREYVEALRSANGTDSYGDKMLELWERYDRAP
ncbi:MAG: multiheme c-type cytochrome, partial [Polyangiaceae bacterium]